MLVANGFDLTLGAKKNDFFSMVMNTTKLLAAARTSATTKAPSNREIQEIKLPVVPDSKQGNRSQDNHQSRQSQREHLLRAVK
ncbi:AAEL007622-PA [Aedes aegypti]|uniref:AAEL007622-PA n=1 Tax=Aedes aegypti TaxID=7159 RepID=Q171L0_AEDAE|nr:AAEL007622-PA [Aedes aegypti]